MKLTAIAIKNAKPGKHSDGEGMYLLVTESGQKYWRFDYRFLGKYKTLALGVYPDTSLAVARSKRAEARTLLASMTTLFNSLQKSGLKLPHLNERPIQMPS
jgi:hypothetical protein